MSNIKTLKPFKKGKDPRRNLKGRPVGSISITKKIREELAKIPDGDKKTQLEEEASKQDKILKISKHWSG